MDALFCSQKYEVQCWITDRRSTTLKIDKIPETDSQLINHTWTELTPGANYSFLVRADYDGSSSNNLTGVQTRKFTSLSRVPPGNNFPIILEYSTIF